MAAARGNTHVSVHSNSNNINNNNNSNNNNHNREKYDTKQQLPQPITLS